MSTVFYVPCLFGLEGLVGDELRRLGMAEVRAENGHVRFSGNAADMARANVSLRCGERVLLELGSFPAESFEALFEGVRALEWERFIPRGGAFPVKGHSLSSALHSVPDCQRIVKKAVAARLGEKYGLEWLPESGETYQIQFAIMKDVATLWLDTSGAGLHKRGYRPAAVAAPLRETLAAAMVYLARYRGRGDFCDPFCGSGTIPVEAALIAKNRAPGLHRSFPAMRWPDFPPALWEQAREEARSREFHGDYRIVGSDVDPKAVAIARENAERAGVDDVVRFEVADALAFDRRTENGVIVTNPPYGERISTPDLLGTYRMIGERLKHHFIGNDAWILSYREECFEQIGLKPSIKIPLYNGSLECELRKYQMFDGKMKIFRSEGGAVKTEEEKRQMAEKHRFRKEREFKQRITEQEENEEGDIRSFTFHRHDLTADRKGERRGQKEERGERKSRFRKDNDDARFPRKGGKPDKNGKYNERQNRGGHERFDRSGGKRTNKRNNRNED